MKKIIPLLLIFSICFSFTGNINFALAEDIKTQTILFSEDIFSQYLKLGQYEEATFYCTQITGNPDASEIDIRAASFGLGKIFYLKNDYSGAISFLLPLAEIGMINQLDTVYYLLAESYFAIGNYPQAITYYQKYNERSNSTIDDIIFEKLGNAYRANGSPTEAIKHYQYALDAYNKEPFDNQVRIGQQYERLGDYPKAIEYYELVRDTTYNNDVVAQMNYFIASAYATQENLPMAINYYQTVVNSHTGSSYAYSALVELVKLEQPVSSYTRGYIDYYADEFRLAITSFGNFINESGTRPLDVLYYLGMSNYHLGDIETAVILFEEIIESFDYNELTNDIAFYGLAYDQLATIYKYDFDDNPADYQAAIDLYIEFASKYPHDDFSPLFVYEAAEQYEINGDLAKAGELYLSVAQRFQNSPNAFDSIIFSGISYYRLGEFSTAFNVFDTASAYSSSPEDHARAFFWKGKTQQALGNTQQAVSYYNQSQNIDYYSYYGLRSEQILDGTIPFSIGMYDVDINLDQFKSEAETWMIQTFALPETIDLYDQTQLNIFPEYQRGEIFLSLEEYELARQEFTALRSRLSGNAHYLYLFAHAMLDLDFYFIAIHSIEDILRLANATDFSITPTYFNYLQHGLYYWDLIYPSANNYVLDPFFIIATMWQESQFKKTAGSIVGAQGLMQIMPITGDFINETLGFDLNNYTINDLHRPNINISFGASYMAYIRRDVYHEPIVMLAAYNAGNKNAQYWLNAVGPEDMDVYVEVIGIEQTRDYVKSIFTIYEVYKSLYEVK